MCKHVCSMQRVPSSGANTRAAATATDYNSDTRLIDQIVAMMNRVASCVLLGFCVNCFVAGAVVELHNRLDLAGRSTRNVTSFGSADHRSALAVGGCQVDQQCKKFALESTARAFIEDVTTRPLEIRYEYIIQAGWPLYSMAGSRCSSSGANGGTPMMISWGLDRSRFTKINHLPIEYVLPLRPMLSGTLANTAAYASLFYIVSLSTGALVSCCEEKRNM